VASPREIESIEGLEGREELVISGGVLNGNAAIESRCL